MQTQDVLNWDRPNRENIYYEIAQDVYINHREQGALNSAVTVRDMA
jgi:hypothetical protein